MADHVLTYAGFNDKLIERVREHSGGPMNFSKWINLWSFDVMGQLSFGKDYEMMDKGELHWALDLLCKSMESAPPRLSSWAFRVLIKIPFAAQGLFKFLKFCRDELQKRIDSKDTSGDITGWLLKAYKDFDKPADDPMFQGDIRLIIVAGSDTTAATLTHLFYHLAKSTSGMHQILTERSMSL